MQFLHPLFLGSLAALALPVLIHFVYKMRAPVVPFPSIRFLRMVDRRVAKRQKIEELLLLLLRCLGLACLALSLAGPLIKQFGNSPGSAGTAAVIVLDDSYSMGALASGGPVFNQAKGMSGTILNTFAPGDSVCLLAGTRKAQFSRDLGALRNELKGLELSNDASTLGARVKAGLELLKNAEAAQRELYIVSDFQRRAADIENLPYDLPSFTPILVPTRPANPDKIENLTLTAFEQISPFATVASPVRVRAVIENAGQQTVSRNLRFRNGETTLASQMVSVAARSTVVVSADLALDKPGWLPLSAELADDGLNADNRRWLACDARAYLGVLVCRPNPQGETGASSRSFYIETALNPAGKSATAPSSGVQILTCTPSDFANQNLDSIAVLFMVECAPKDEDGRRLLNNFVARGGGLAIVAGTGITPDIFNTGFFRENDPAGPLSPAKVTGSWGASDADPNHETVAEFIKDVAAQHPIFARLRRGEIPVELSAAAFYHFARVEPAEHFGAQVLARFGNKAPAIVEHPYGLGRVVLIASALHADATQLPLRVSFLPLMQCLTLHLLSTGRSDALKVGEHVSTQLFKDKAPPSAVAVFSPTDRREIAGQQVGSTVTYDFGPAPAPGAIPIEWTDGGRKLNRLVAVNVEPDEGKLEYVEPQSLKIPKAVVVNDEGQLMALLNHIRFGHNLSLQALGLAILFLLGEALLANWLAFGRAGGEK